MDQDKKTGEQKNEGEGNRTAARAFNEAEKRFVQSGQVEQKAKEAKAAVNGPEGDALRAAEKVGLSHVAEEDPAVKRKR